MQREIKFRGKRVDNGEWVYGDLMTGKNPSITWWKPTSNDSYEIDCADVDPLTVGQYTGVHDDTDDQAEFYDGDIAEVDYEGQKHICKVQYCGSGYMFVADSLPDGYLWFSRIIEFDRKYCWAEGTKKLGTRWDNPELLGG